MTNVLTEADRFLLAARLEGYLGHNREAVQILTEGLNHTPGDVRLLQLRGVKRLIARDVHGALEDLDQAAAGLAGVPDEIEFYRTVIERDVINILLGRLGRIGAQHPVVDEASAAATKHLSRGTLHASTWFHLGVARYLVRDFVSAGEAFEVSRSAALDDHQIVAALDWQFMSWQRAGMGDEAVWLLSHLDAVSYDPEQLDSPCVPNSLKGCYVQRLRMYRGELKPEDLLRRDTEDSLALATLGYGVGNWYLSHGFTAAARRSFDRVLELGDPTTLGYLAAEFEGQNCESRSFVSSP